MARRSFARAALHLLGLGTIVLLCGACAGASSSGADGGGDVRVDSVGEAPADSVTPGDGTSDLLDGIFDTLKDAHPEVDALPGEPDVESSPEPIVPEPVAEPDVEVTNPEQGSEVAPEVDTLTPCDPADCDPGEGCAPEGPCGPCASADECREGEACRNPGAGGECGACRVADECRVGEACLEGVCGPCDGEGADCSGRLCGGTACVACVPSGDDAACESAYGAGFFCNESERCTTSCTDLFDCLVVGRVCDGFTNTCAPCTGPDACEEAGYGLGTPCIEGVCLEASCVGATACLDKGLTERPVCALDGTCRPCALPDQVDSDCAAALAIASAVCVPGGTCAPGDCRPEGSACGTTGEKICRADASGFWCTACQSDLECVAAHDGLAHMICEAGACAEGCESKDDCEPGQICQGHRCGACAVNADCGEYPGAYLCVGGACLDVMCNDEKPCEGAMQCVANACVECVENADCPATTPICEQGTCHACLAGQCGAGHVCAGGACLVGDCTPVGARCDGTADRICGDENGESWCRDCASDDECVAAFDGLAHMVCVGADDVVAGVPGRCAEGCVDKDDCAEPGQVCLQHRCEACGANEDCAGAYGDWLCVDGACLDVACNDEKPCEGSQKCVANACVDCTDDSECAGSKPICRSGVCEACSNGECGPGKVCLPSGCEAGDCWIEGQVWSAGAKSAEEPCLKCDPATPNAWSANPGAGCDDGVACSHGDTCGATVGACAGLAYTCSAPPESATCARGVCHGTGPGDCTIEKKESWTGCFLDAACYAINAANPANPCEVCGASTGRWIAKPTNTRCGFCQTCQVNEGDTSCQFVPVGDDPHNDCTASCQVCDGWGGCRLAGAGTDPNENCPADPPASCGHDGSCVASSGACAFWTSVDGVDDGNECTTNDRCDGLGTKTGTAVPNGTRCLEDTKVCRNGACSDCINSGECGLGKVCNGTSCVVGNCSKDSDCGTAPACEKFQCQQNQCVLVNDNSLACSDGNACTTNDYCLDGSCTATEWRNCSHLNGACQIGQCNAVSGQCEAKNKATGTPCPDDGNDCTVNERCDSNGLCSVSEPLCTPDPFDCTIDCIDGACKYALRERTCLIGDACYAEGDRNPADECFECVPSGTAAKPTAWSYGGKGCDNFDDECHKSACQSTGCYAINRSNTTPCHDDGIGCTTDLCKSGVCVHTESDALCNVDQLPWTFEDCDLALPGCIDRGWVRILGGSTEANADVSASNVLLAPSGDLLVVGTYAGSQDFDGTAGTDVHSGPGIFVTRFTTSNTYVWTRTCPGSALTYDAVTDAAGSIYVTGSFGGTVDFDPGPSVQERTAQTDGESSSFILKLDSNGVFQWVATFGGDYDAKATAISVAGDIVAVTGYFFGTADLNPSSSGTASFTSHSMNRPDVFVSRFDAAGTFKWARTLYSSYALDGDAVVAEPDGEVVLGGYYRGLVDFDPTGSVQERTSTGSTGDGFLLKLSATGTYVWVKEFGGSSASDVRDVLIDSVGNFYVTGRYTGDIDVNPGSGEKIYTSTGFVTYVVSLTSSGAYAWSNGSLPASALELTRTDGGVLVSLSGTNGSSPDTVYVSKLSSTGTVLASSSHAGDGLLGASVVYDGTYYYLASPGGFDFDPSSVEYPETGTGYSFVIRSYDKF